jgi:hypothetical protein
MNSISTHFKFRPVQSAKFQRNSAKYAKFVNPAEEAVSLLLLPMFFSCLCCRCALFPIIRLRVQVKKICYFRMSNWPSVLDIPQERRIEILGLLLVRFCLSGWGGDLRIACLCLPPGPSPRSCVSRAGNGQMIWVMLSDALFTR